jgi:uncharacterized surface protein with fasciclin (FAS1) repeats
MRKRMMAITTAIAVLAISVGAASAAPNKNIVETAASSPKFDTLVELVQQAGLAGTLSGPKNYTVFAPTDAAFAKVPKSTLNALANNRRMLRKVLLYHVVAGKLPASKVVKRAGAKTLEGSRVRFTVRGNRAFVNNARIIQADIRTSNGIVHAINKVLIPPTG